MKKLISDFFFYNRRQKIGVLVFSLITLVNCYFIVNDPFLDLEIYDFSALSAELDSLNNLTSDNDSIKNEYVNGEDKFLIERFDFDPNNASLGDFRRLGFDDKLSQRIINYREKGGRFHSADDLKKIYGMNEELFNNVKELVTLTPANNQKRLEFERSEIKKNQRVIVEINEADSIALCSIRGIGPAFARRIIRYRERLGGFVKSGQLLEVYGIDSAKFSSMNTSIIADPAKIRRIRVNLISEAELANHPYAGYKLSKKIIAYRIQHGNFLSMKDFEMMENVSPAEIEKIKPYLSLQ